MSEKPSSTCLVTGGAGFIGSHLIDALLSDQTIGEVRVLDNFSSGRREHLAHHQNNSRLKVHAVELLDLEKILPHFKGINTVFHLAANPDARWGIDNTRLDLEQETIVTYNVLESMRRNNVPQIVFSSSGTVYGDVGTAVTHEGLGPCLPVSLYGAGKVASEGLISAFCGTFGMRAVIFRFGNIIGERTTHGAVFDFIRQLAKNSSELKVLGNGFQAKPYVYVRDLAQGLVFGKKKCGELEASKFDVFNLAPGGATNVRFIAEELVSQLGFAGRTRILYGESAQGWPGDVPQSRIDSAKLAGAGFSLSRSSDEAVRFAINRIFQWLAERTSDDGLRLPSDARLSLSR
ncbi:MAG TPA: NAD-dependent epimerase/dehydratase family protein [Candidatus Acidoferrum sp.]|nr:NAD-dependent epimerase/dehydratase family protein [Candidatus Acidoferrum sp.]